VNALNKLITGERIGWLGVSVLAALAGVMATVAIHFFGNIRYLP
jgi:hypothetical protein